MAVGVPPGPLMLWREAYRTRVARDWSPPPMPVLRTLNGDVVDLASARAVFGGFEPSALSEIALWRRLAWDAGRPEGLWSVYLDVEADTLASLVAPSQADVTACGSDPGGVWRTAVLLPSDPPGRAFAWCPAAALLMVGPATEDAWDEFAAALERA